MGWTRLQQPHSFGSHLDKDHSGPAEAHSCDMRQPVRKSNLSPGGKSSTVQPVSDGFPSIFVHRAEVPEANARQV